MLRDVAAALEEAAARGERVVLATVVRVVGSSYGGVGARMLARVDGTTVGLVSGGCLESDLAEHARRVHDAERAEVVAYDTRADDDAVWGLGLGCNGAIDVLLAPLDAPRARATAALLGAALGGEAPAVLATVVRADDPTHVGACALLGAAAPADGAPHVVGAWPAGALDAARAHVADALGAGRRGLVASCAGAEVAFEVVVPLPRLVICGSGPDAVPVARLGMELGWDVTVVDHRGPSHLPTARFPGARVVSCAEPATLGGTVPLGARTAAVVMSHHFARDAAYLGALLASRAAYVGALGPRARTERLIAELAASGVVLPGDAGARLHAPVGLDLGGDGPAAIALAIVSEASAALHGRAGGFLRDRTAPLHGAADPRPAARTRAER